MLQCCHIVLCLEILDKTGRCAGALSWRRHQLLVLHFSGRFVVTIPKTTKDVSAAIVVNYTSEFRELFEATSSTVVWATTAYLQILVYFPPRCVTSSVVIATFNNTKLPAWLHIISIFRRRIECKPSVRIWSGLIQACISTFYSFVRSLWIHFYISLPFSIFFNLFMAESHTFFCSLYLRFFCKVLSFLWLVYYTCAHLLLFPCIRLLFSVSNRHSLDASDTIITYIRVKNADVKFLQTSFVLSSLLQYFECTQLQPWVLDADFDTCQLHFRTLHTIQASPRGQMMVNVWLGWYLSNFSVDTDTTCK